MWEEEEGEEEGDSTPQHKSKAGPLLPCFFQGVSIHPVYTSQTAALFTGQEVPHSGFMEIRQGGDMTRHGKMSR